MTRRLTSPQAPNHADHTARSAPLRGQKKAARKGVLSSFRPRPQPPVSAPPGDGRAPVAWLHVTAPPDWRAIPSATSWCQCGRYRTATGRTDVLQLVEDHDGHRDACPLRTTESRNAA
ncbi:hypothetical protein ACFOSC_18150 [Streptantibioticus rubrisoli]|uniref:Uncharacterized protein n=1 Tax=Streptantibioticus rubrisoli TaxID=1387313 RepID=A0ABT1PJF4_9ACTN|nr:hypothetical protein [Streptantibioticus rubrisoli]MCQ4044643.1 hypothetical protein [Streptantibioticus rubrisoli]